MQSSASTSVANVRDPALLTTRRQWSGSGEASLFTSQEGWAGCRILRRFASLRSLVGGAISRRKLPVLTSVDRDQPALSCLCRGPRAMSDRGAPWHLDLLAPRGRGPARSARRRRVPRHSGRASTPSPAARPTQPTTTTADADAGGLRTQSRSGFHDGWTVWLWRGSARAERLDLCSTSSM